MTTLDHRQTPDPTLETTRLRVVLLLDVLDGKQERFLEAYEQIRHQVADVPGHISDQLCQSLGNSSQWLITSEWEDSEPFLAWVESAAHRKMVEPLHGCVRDTTSLRFVIARETPDPARGEPSKDWRRGGPEAMAARIRAAVPMTGGTDPLPTPPLCSGGVVRHAITFTVKPGSEKKVADILSRYKSPQARVDDTTQLRRTSLFMHGNRVVRAVEVTGDLGNALRHVAAQPEIRAVEEEINPYLEEDRDLSDGSSARAFFARAALPAVEHTTGKPSREAADGVTRRAFHYAVKPGCGAAAAKMLAELDKAAVADPEQPLVGSTVFHRDDVLVRVADLREQGAGKARKASGAAAKAAPKAGAAKAGKAGKAAGAKAATPAKAVKAAEELRKLLDPASMDAPADLLADPAFGGRPMNLLTDRSSQDA
ncbi:SchA/CurD-like domain-containing protein [Streptomyces sp. NPDC051976]|uniref:SchA/CurD-like domain-containing protein n=1 Tax=Streptomyces sp. NPDC051976 TaxID=3154947 RepID=UPI003436A1B6